MNKKDQHVVDWAVTEQPIVLEQEKLEMVPMYRTEDIHVFFSGLPLN